MKNFLSVIFIVLMVALNARAVDNLGLTQTGNITATGGSQALNVSGYSGFSEADFQSYNTAGTSPTLAIKLQGSDNPVLGTAATTVGATDNILRATSNTTLGLSAMWTQSGAASISTVTLMLKSVGTITAGKVITLNIDTDTAGSPSNTSLGTAGNIVVDGIGTTYAPVTFTFDKPVDVADATAYHFVLTGNYTASSSNHIKWRSLTVASGGTQNTSADGSTWVAVTTQTPEVYATQYAFTDISGATFTGSTTGGSPLRRVGLYAPNVPVFIRWYYTIGGTSTPTYYVFCSYSGTKAH